MNYLFERIDSKQGRRHKLKSIWSFQVKFEIKGKNTILLEIKAQVIVTRWREKKTEKTVKVTQQF